MSLIKNILGVLGSPVATGTSEPTGLYQLRPTRALTNQEITDLLTQVVQFRIIDTAKYNTLPASLKQHFKSTKLSGK